MVAEIFRSICPGQISAWDAAAVWTLYPLAALSSTSAACSRPPVSLPASLPAAVSGSKRNVSAFCSSAAALTA